MTFRSLAHLLLVWTWEPVTLPPRASRAASWACDLCSRRALHLEAPHTWLMLCCDCLKIFHTFWKRSPMLSFHTVLCKLCSESWWPDLILFICLAREWALGAFAPSLPTYVTDDTGGRLTSHSPYWLPWRSGQHGECWGLWVYNPDLTRRHNALILRNTWNPERQPVCPFERTQKVMLRVMRTQSCSSEGLSSWSCTCRKRTKRQALSPYLSVLAYPLFI